MISANQYISLAPIGSLKKKRKKKSVFFCLFLSATEHKITWEKEARKAACLSAFTSPLMTKRVNNLVSLHVLLEWQLADTGQELLIHISCNKQTHIKQGMTDTSVQCSVNLSIKSKGQQIASIQL